MNEHLLAERKKGKKTLTLYLLTPASQSSGTRNSST